MPGPTSSPLTALSDPTDLPALREALAAEDPDGRCVPICLSGGTDAKSFSELGIRCFGFSPLRLPPELDFAGMFHGVDERVPTASTSVENR